MQKRAVLVRISIYGSKGPTKRHLGFYFVFVLFSSLSGGFDD